MEDPLWFCLRHRGKKPSVFVRDDLYMSPEDSAKLDRALILIVNITGVRHDLIGVKLASNKRITYRRFPGIVRPNITNKIVEMLGEPGKMPNDLSIPGYFEKDKSKA